ncbi:autophagy-related protein 18a-like [Phragmites australis]|uniref:autophagy-related protein 18a-like n=1 Tax=Phragmites australis TaxID=29695 RepID=UPI002D76CAB0|nr:autophagy-related protein 18a-like [Phragmites australis]
MAVGVSIASHNLSSVEIPNGPPHRLLHVSFNQDGGCFAASTTGGFRIYNYNCEPFREIFRRDLVNNAAGGRGGAGGGVKTVEMLFRTNILALIDGGENPHANKVVIWDDHQRCCVGLLTGCGSSARPSLRRDAAQPRSARGTGEGGAPRARGGRTKTLLDDEHPASAVPCLALSRTAGWWAVATAGAGGAGAAVRVFDAADGKMLREASLAPGSEVHSLAFSADARFLATSGDGGAVQVFGLPVEGQDGGASSHSSASRFRIGDGERCIVAFGAQSNTVVAVGMGGSFCRCRFNQVHGGEMELLERRDFM